VSIPWRAASGTDTNVTGSSPETWQTQLTLAPADAGIVIHALARESIDSHFIGQVVPREQGVVLVQGNRQEPLPVFAQDEIAKLFAAPGGSV